MSRVDLRIDAGELAGTFDHMRIWLDRRDCVPVMFDPIGNQTGPVVLHVDFEEDAVADAFRQEFGATGRGQQGSCRSGHISWPEKVCAKTMASPSALNCR